MTIGLKANNDGSGAIQVNGVDRATVDTSGNVGIGTSSPTGLLDVFSSSTGVIRSRGSSVTAYMFGSSGGGLGAVGTETNHPFGLYANGVERARIDTSGNFQFNSGYGSVATAYGCRAWVNFNGTGTVAIRGSGNVSSITDNGTGEYTVNFTNALPDANYCPVGISSGSAQYSLFYDSPVAKTTSAYRFSTLYANTLGGGGAVVDSVNVQVAIFR